MNLCADKSPLDVGDPCVRASWGALIPGVFVFALCLFSITPIRHLFEPVTPRVRSYLTLSEAEALREQGPLEDKPVVQRAEGALDRVSKSLWRTLIFVLVGIMETLCWLAYGSYLIYSDNNHWWKGTRALIYASVWLFTAICPVARPSMTPPFDVLVVYLLLFAVGILELGGYMYDHSAYQVPLPNWDILILTTMNLVATTGMLIVVGGMPLALPSNRVKEDDIGRTVTAEDYTSLFGWVTFSWVYPLVRKGRYETLNEDDVWDLSPTLQSRPVFIKFGRTKRSTLLRRIWAANSLDLILDFSLTLVSVAFNYMGPFFLQRILREIDNENLSRASRNKAYIYALLAFLCTIAKAQTDVQHLWFGRRASTRIRSELMASIYEKALKRKDYSGITARNTTEEREEKADAGYSKNRSKIEKKVKKDDATKADDPKAGADVGKIVNLMAGDANRIAQTCSALYFLYGAPFEIAIAGVFLYQLLGWSAFAGFGVLLIGWPLNNIISRRSVRIQKGILAARDKRMGVLSELIGSVKFIKFFAWEEGWIQRALDARRYELRWMVKARFNSVMFYVLWSCAPILVSITSFLAYVLQGNVLDVSTAFTAIALFGMIRLPLNIVPTYIIQLLQTRVALDRISVYLDEDEVSEQVSSLKNASAPPSAGENLDLEDGLGFDGASFRWNEVPQQKEDDTRSNMNEMAHDPSSTSMRDSSSSSREASSDEVESTSTDFTALDEDRRFELKDLSIRFPEGELTIVTGPTASGKTALLMALLGEMTTTSGRIIMCKKPSQVDENGLMHSISYAAQSPWLRHQSIKDNILFGYPFDEERYNAVIEACALRPDLEMLEDGDQTEIGARGVSLSGGQKARVALARVVYARTKYILLDDPLSAVVGLLKHVLIVVEVPYLQFQDSHTSRFLYEHLFQGPLLVDRTVILVTHHVELVLPGAYYLVRMLDGRIDTHGTIKDLRSQGALDNIAYDAGVEVKKHEVVVTKACTTEVEGTAVRGDAAGIETPKDAVTKKPRKLVKDEHRDTGGVKWRIYKSYLKASSYWTWVILGALVVITQLLGVGEKFWVKTWGEAYERHDRVPDYAFRSFSAMEYEIPMNGYPSSYQQHSHQTLPRTFSFGMSDISWPDAMNHPYFYIGIYAAIGLGTAFANVLSVTTQYTGALRASRMLFKQLLVTVVRATFRFHDTTPQGRMLNRFGKDIETIDSSLAGSLQAVNSSLASFFAAILTVAVIFPGFLIPAFFIGFGYYELAIGYLNTGRDLRRMESNSRSPIFSDFGELLEGIVTVRAFSAENRFLNSLHRKIDITTKMWYGFWMTNRWLLLNFDTLGGLAVLVTTFFSISTLANGAGLAGVCITSAMAFTMSVYWACRFWTALELDLNSVERVVEYLDLPQEPPAIIESNRAPAYWPSSSSGPSLISVENLTVKYAPELPSVLRNVSFSLGPGERVGLLGRTGSGKSTLAMSILRFVDPTEGNIVIDGIDITTIGVQDLRSRITFIPQDATLFSGTLRDNLDPFNEYTDAECLDVLQRVQMIGKIPGSISRDQSTLASPSDSRTPSIHQELTSTSNLDIDSASSVLTIPSTPTEVDSNKTNITLETQISAGGVNFSQGQRQLIAMARALLRRTSIIVLDEATSSIDFATDAKIQQTIREEFTNSLLLTVAHRLRTVIDYDRLIVLDHGQIAEIGSPWDLIHRGDGIFRNMCLKSGSFSELEAAARVKAEGTTGK